MPEAGRGRIRYTWCRVMAVRQNRTPDTDTDPDAGGLRLRGSAEWCVPKRGFSHHEEHEEHEGLPIEMLDAILPLRVPKMDQPTGIAHAWIPATPDHARDKPRSHSRSPGSTARHIPSFVSLRALRGERSRAIDPDPDADAGGLRLRGSAEWCVPKRGFSHHEEHEEHEGLPIEMLDAILPLRVPKMDQSTGIARRWLPATPDHARDKPRSHSRSPGSTARHIPSFVSLRALRGERSRAPDPDPDARGLRLRKSD